MKLNRPILPQTSEGKKAVALGIAVIVWGILMPILPYPGEWMGKISGLLGGFSRVVIEVVLIAFTIRYMNKAVFKVKDRAVLVMIIFIPFCVIAGFWIIFAAGEVIVPH